MTGFANVLIGAGVLILAFDLLVLRLMLRKRPGHTLVAVAALCLVGALLLLWLLPPGTAH